MAFAPRAELLLDADFETMIISHGLFGVRGLAVGNLCLRLLVKIASIFRGCLGTGVLRSAFTTRSVFSWSLFYTQGLSLQNFRRSDCFGFGGPAELPSGDPESGLHLSSTTSAPTEPIIEASGSRSLPWPRGTHLLPTRAWPWLTPRLGTEK